MIQNQRLFLARLLTVWLSLGLPHSALALRDSIEDGTPAQIAAGLEEIGTIAAGRRALQELIADVNMDGVIQVLVESGVQGDITEEYFPELSEKVKRSGYQEGTATVVPIGDLPDVPLGTSITVYVHPETPEASKIEQALKQVQNVTVVPGLKEVTLVIADENDTTLELTPNQALLQVNLQTSTWLRDRAKQLLRYLEQERLLLPGTIVSLSRLFSGSFGKALLVFA